MNFNFKDLSNEILGDVIDSQHVDFKRELSKVWSGTLWRCKVLAFVKVRAATDIATTLKFCENNKLDVCVRSGGYSDRYGQADNHVVIDMNHMTSIDIDVKNKTAVIGAGVKAGHFIKETMKYNLVTPLGGAFRVSVIGQTLRFGLGCLSRQYGFAMDNVLEYEMVTSKGECLRVSKEENPELFWGMKLYGANFGVVTSLKFQLHEIRDLITGGQLVYDGSRAQEVFQIIRDFQEAKSDPRFFIESYYLASTGAGSIFMNLFFDGPEEEGNALVDELVTKSNPTVKSISRMRYDDYIELIAHEKASPNGLFYYVPGVYFFSDLTDEIIEFFLKLCHESPVLNENVKFLVLFCPMGGKVAAHSGDEGGAFPARKAKYYYEYIGIANEEKDYDALKTWVDKVHAETLRFNYNPPNEAEIKERLKLLKRKYDPNNIFHLVERNINPEN